MKTSKTKKANSKKTKTVAADEKNVPKTSIFDSSEEEYFYWYLKELEGEGVIHSIERCESLLMCEKVTRMIGKKEVKFFDERIYTPDFKFKVSNASKWFDDFENPTVNPNSKKDFAMYHQNGIVYVEVKGARDMHNMIRVFRLNQKEVMNKHGIFVNLVKVPDIFKKTFTPVKYLSTDKTGKPRKINWKVNLL